MDDYEQRCANEDICNVRVIHADKIEQAHRKVISDERPRSSSPWATPSSGPSTTPDWFAA